VSVSMTEQTGDSEAIHSPEAWRSGARLREGLLGSC
jgi:hypothetical protein